MPVKPASFPVHTLLLPVFFVLHTLNGYYALLPIAEIMQALLYYLVLALILVMTGKMLFRSFRKAGVWATCLLLPFFFFGALHDLAKRVSLPSFFVSYTFILPLLLLGSIAFTVYIKRTASHFHKLAGYLLTVFAVLAGIETVHLLYNLVTHKEDLQNLAVDNPAVLNNIQFDNRYAPDIFFIVFDEFTSTNALKKYFSYNNAQLDSALTSNRFYIARNSKSNYNSTPVSIAATLNCQYFNKPLEDHPATDKMILQSWYTLKMNDLPDILKKAGYGIYNFGVGDLKDHPARNDRYFANYELMVIHGATLWGRIKRDILWNIFRHFPSFIAKKQQKEFLRQRDRFIAGNRNNQDLLLHELNTQSQQPKFVFGHIMMPHAPFYYDRNGRSTNLLSSVYDFRNQKELYLDQLIYTNTWVEALAKAANQPFARPRVVIIEGDHGYRDPFLPNTHDLHYMNLNCWYFSDQNYTMLYDSISPVNTFRVILNKYFNTRLPLLQDSIIHMR